MKTTSIIAAAVIALLPTLGHTATVVNGSFEMDPGVISQGVSGHGAGSSFAGMPTEGRSWGIWTTGIPGWTTSSNGIELQTARTLGLTPADGDYYAELDTRRNTRITQDIFFDVGTYDLTFAYSPRTKNPDTNGVGFGIGDVLADSVTGPNGDYARGEFTYVTRRFEITEAGTQSLFFAGIGNSNSYGGLIDDVSLSTVPLPAGLLLMGTALVGFGAARRRRKS